MYVERVNDGEIHWNPTKLPNRWELMARGGVGTEALLGKLEDPPDELPYANLVAQHAALADGWPVIGSLLTNGGVIRANGEVKLVSLQAESLKPVFPVQSSIRLLTDVAQADVLALKTYTLREKYRADLTQWGIKKTDQQTLLHFIDPDLKGRLRVGIGIRRIYFSTHICPDLREFESALVNFMKKIYQTRKIEDTRFITASAAVRQKIYDLAIKEAEKTGDPEGIDQVNLNEDPHVEEVLFGRQELSSMNS